MRGYIAATCYAVADLLHGDCVWFVDDIPQVSVVEMDDKDADDSLQWRMLSN